MPHRVLIDFNCPGESLSRQRSSSSKGSDVEVYNLPGKVEKALVSSGRWSSAEFAEKQEIIDRMAAQLPENDIASFVKNVQLAMQRKGPYADLTIGWYVDAGVGKVRVRIASKSEAFLAELSRETATLLLREFPELDLTYMAMFQARDDDALINGRQQMTHRYQFWGRDNLPVALPFVLSLGVIVIGGIWALWTWEDPKSPTLMGGTFAVWYERLFGPMLMALITLGSTIFRDMRRQRRDRVRYAEWSI